MAREPLPVIYEDEKDMIHTTKRPFCPTPECPCHEDSELIQEVHIAYTEGLVTAEEATNIVKGMSVG